MASEFRGQLSTPTDVVRFMNAGDATITLVSKKTGVRFTYLFGKSKNPHTQRAHQPIWVSVLTGPDNTNSFSFAGGLYPTDGWKFGKSFKSQISESAPSIKALMWAVKKLVIDGAPATSMPEELEVWHEGKCGRCGRKLTVPESVANGYGPECAGKMGM